MQGWGRIDGLVIAKSNTVDKLRNVITLHTVSQERLLPETARTRVGQVEKGHALAPKFDADGPIPPRHHRADIGIVLMPGYSSRYATTDGRPKTVAQSLS